MQRAEEEEKNGGRGERTRSDQIVTWEEGGQLTSDLIRPGLSDLNNE